MNANEGNEGDQLQPFEFDCISNTVFDEMQLVQEAREAEALQSQQTNTASPEIRKNVVQRPSRPPKRAKTKTPTAPTGSGKGISTSLAPGGGSGRGKVGLLTGGTGGQIRRRSRTEFQEHIEGVGKRTSPVWNEFTIVAERDENGVVVSLHVVCRYCNDTDYRAEGHYGTSTHKRHLEVCEPYQKWLAKHGDSIGDFDQKKYCSLFAKAISAENFFSRHTFTAPRFWPPLNSRRLFVLKISTPSCAQNKYATQFCAKILSAFLSRDISTALLCTKILDAFLC